LKPVRSFSLSPEVVEQIDTIPGRERSRVVDQILRRALPYFQFNGGDVIDRREVERVVREVLAEIIGERSQ
jgi:hypothetical protein